MFRDVRSIHLPFTELEVRLRGRVFTGQTVDVHIPKMVISSPSDFSFRHVDVTDHPLEARSGDRVYPSSRVTDVEMDIRGRPMAQGEDKHLYKMKVVDDNQSRQEMEDLAELIWRVSRGDEGTISATGAEVLASRLIASGYRKGL